MLWNWIEMVSIDHFPPCVISACCSWQREHEPPAQTQTDTYNTFLWTQTHTESSLLKKYSMLFAHFDKCNTLHHRGKGILSWHFMEISTLLLRIGGGNKKVTAPVELWQTGFCVTDLRRLFKQSQILPSLHSPVYIPHYSDLSYQSAISDNTFQVCKGHSVV